MHIHHDGIDLLVTAAIASLTDNSDLKHNPQALVTAADTFGQMLTTALAASPTDNNNYQWQPVAELLTPTLVDDLILQIERTRLTYISICSTHNDWPDSPAHRYVDRLGITIRERLNRGTTNPNQMILTSSDLKETRAHWRRPTIHFHTSLTDHQEHNHGQP